MKYGGVKAKQMMFGGLGILVVVGIVLVILWQTGVIFKKAAPAAPSSAAAPSSPQTQVGPGGQQRPIGQQ